MVERMPRDRFRHHDYTKEVVKSRPQRPVSLPPYALPQKIAEPKIYPKTKIGKLIILSLSLVILGAGGTFAWTRFAADKNPIPENIRNNTPFQLLYPSQLPAGYKLNDKSYEYTGQVVTYYADGDNGQKLSFSVQQRPPTFDFKAFYEQGISEATEFISPLGQGAAGKANGRALASLVSGTSWVLISPSDNSITPETLKEVAVNLKKSD